MHTDVWYHLMIRELSKEDLWNERLREAEAVYLPAAGLTVKLEAVKGQSEEAPPTS